MYLTKKMYSLEEIIKALKANSTLQFNAIDSLGCPTKVPCTEVHLNECHNIPSKCDRCQNQSCFQYLVVNCKNNASGVRLVILKFRFQIQVKSGSGSVGSGFIPKEDSQLKRLIGKKYIKI